jgi:hypothetical protein
MKQLLLAGSCIVLLCGCQSNYYAQKYKDMKGPGAERFLLPHTAAAQVVRVEVADLPAETRKYEQRGYLAIGYSRFVADSDNYSAQLHAQADQVQADLVLSAITAAGYRNDVVAMDQAPTMSNMSNSGGYLPPSGGKVAATPSLGSPSASDNTSVASLSDSVPQSEYVAVFMRRHVVLLGANLDDRRPPASPGAGMAIASIVAGSPAATAGLVPGDFITAVDGETFADLNAYKALIDARAGKLVHLSVVRGGAETTVDVQLNSLQAAPKS